MAWNWSHTQEAYSNAYNNLHALGRKTLEVIWAEWETAKIKRDDFGEPYFNEYRYKIHLARARKLPADILADSIWERMQEQATCDNGGFNAWTCPYGCGCHTVSFDPAEETADTN